MTVNSLLGELRSKDVKIKVNDDRLTLDAPKGTLDDGLVAQIREHKAELLAILNPRPPRHAGGFPATDADHPCVTCGGTRAMMSLARMDVLEALLMNPLVALAGIAAAVYAVHAAGVWLLGWKRWRPTVTSGRARLALRAGVIAALLLNWAYLIAVGR